MRSIDAVERDGRYVVTVRTLPDPEPRAGEVLVRVAASGVNRADLAQIAGRYPAPPGEPEGLGLEVSGVDATGARVCALLAGGGHADRAVVPVGQMFPAPDHTDLTTAGAIPEAYLTAFVNLVVEAELTAGECVLVHAGASGVGLAAIQLAKFLGARVAATTRTRDKIAALEAAGADLAIETAHGDFAAEIASRWGRDAINVILDPVGAATLPGDLSVLAGGGRGRIVSLATMAGAQASLDLLLLMKKRAWIMGSTLRARSREEKAAIVARFAREVLPGFEAGRLAPVIDSVFPPERAAEAFQRMRDNRSVGKIVIDWTLPKP